jgi:hypothetical protein
MACRKSHHLAALDASVTLTCPAQRLLPRPNLFHGIRRVIRRGMTRPREDPRHALLALLFLVLHDDLLENKEVKWGVSGKELYPLDGTGGGRLPAGTSVTPKCIPPKLLDRTRNESVSNL